MGYTVYLLFVFVIVKPVFCKQSLCNVDCQAVNEGGRLSKIEFNLSINSHFLFSRADPSRFLKEESWIDHGEGQADCSAVQLGIE